MQISWFKVRNFRSIWYKGQEPTFSLSLSPGINYLVGPNNCGKSNVLRALELAFHDIEANKFNMATDSPTPLTFSNPTMEIHFRKNTSYSSENTLFKYAREYEDDVRAGKPTLAERGELRWVVKYSKSGRDDSFAISGAGGRSGSPDLRKKILKQLLAACHFIYIPSGQGIEELFKGAFQSILKSVLEEHLWVKLKQANESKDEYLNTIKRDLLSPLQEILGCRLKNVIHEIEKVEVIPNIPDIDKQIAQAAIRIKAKGNRGSQYNVNCAN